MPNLTQPEERRLLNASLDGTYLCLFTADPGVSGGFASEMAGGGYARRLASFSAAATVSGLTTKALLADVAFPVATADYPSPLTHVGLASSLAGGILRWSGPLATPGVVVAGAAFVMRAADTSFGMD